MRKGRFTTVIGITLIVGFPTFFWLLVAELTLLAQGWDYGMTGRLLIAGLVLAVTLMVWAMLQLSDSSDDDSQTHDLRDMGCDRKQNDTC